MSKPELNPEDQQAKKRFDFDPSQAKQLRQSEEAGANLTEQSAPVAEVDAARQAEQAGVEDFGYQANVNDMNTPENRRGWRAKFTSALKRGGPVTAVVGSLVGGSMFMSIVMSPALAINHMYEMLVEKFDYQAHTNTARFRHLGSEKWAEKAFTKTKGGFSSKKARFREISEAQLKRLNRAGFVVEIDESTVSGKKRMRIKSMELVDEVSGKRTKIGSLGDFKKAWRDPTFRRQYKQGFKGSFGQFSDQISSKVFQKLAFSKASIDSTRVKSGSGDDKDFAADKKQTAAELDDALDDAINGKLDNFSSQQAHLTEELNKAEADAKNGVKGAKEREVGAKAMNNAGREISELIDSKTKFAPGSKLPSVVNVVGLVGDTCNLIKITSAAIYASKVVFGQNLGRYAVAFLSFADKIRSGEATEEEITYFGNKLMASKTFQDERGQSNYSKTAFDSMGYDYLTGAHSTVNKTGTGAKDSTAFNPVLDSSAKNFQIGANGEIIQLYQTLIKDAPAVLRSGCDTLTSKAGQAAQAAVGVAFLSVSIAAAGGTGGFSVIAQLALGIAGTAAYTIIANFIEAKLSAALTGNVASSATEGEDMGNALTAGSGYAMTQISRAGANMPMDKQSSLAYLNDYRAFVAETGEEIRATRSPFDINTRHTMMGSIVNNLLPQVAKMYSFSGKIGSLIQTAKASIVSLTPISRATALVDDKAYLEMCSDPSLPAGSAFDPFCNPVLGLPMTAINSPGYSPIEVLEYFEKQPSETFRRWFKPVDESGNDCYLNDGYLYSSSSKDRQCPEDYQWRINDLAKDDGWVRACAGGNCSWQKAAGNKSYAERDMNELYNYSLNCVYRPEDVPWGADSLGRDSDHEGWFGERPELGGAKWRKVYDGGESCVIDHNNLDEINKMRTMFSLYFMDERLQCILDDGQECQLERNAHYGV